jgi:hypothetical protein
MPGAPLSATAPARLYGVLDPRQGRCGNVTTDRTTALDRIEKRLDRVARDLDLLAADVESGWPMPAAVAGCGDATSDPREPRR